MTPIAPAKTTNYARAALLLIYIIAVIILSSFHEFWLDELHVWEMDVNNSFWKVLCLMAEEGHFMTWHLLIMPFAKAGISCSIGLRLVSVTFMAAAAWWLIYRSDFSFLSKFCILFSLPSVYVFPAICRVYAIIPLILYLIASTYPHRDTHPVRYGILIGLLINTHLYMEGLALSLLAFWAYEIWQDRSRPGSRKMALGWCIAIIFGLLAFAQIVGNFFQITTPAFQLTNDPSHLTFDLMDRYLSMIHIFCTHIVPGSLYGVSCLIFAVMFIGWYCYIMRRSKKELVIVIASIVYQMLFGLYIYYCQGQRFYLPYYIMIFGLWAAGQASTKECTYFITFLLLVNVYFNYTLLKRDIVQPFEIYQGVSDIYRNDQNPVKITDTSYPVIVLKSCYDPSLHASDINASSESEIFAAVDSLKPERFTIYGSQTDYGTLEYDIIEDSLSNVGYTVTHIRMPFNWSAGNFNVLKCEQKPN